MSHQTSYPPYARVDTYAEPSPKPSFDNSPHGYFDDRDPDPQGAASRRFQERQHAALPALLDSSYSSGTAGWSPNVTEKTRSTGNRKKWIWGGIIVGLIVLGAAGGAGIGISMSRSNATSTSDKDKDSSTGSGDPSKFTADERLKKSFWGIAYESESVQVPACGATQANVTRDIQLLSQLTSRIRMYGSNCNQTALVMQAIQDTKVDLDVYLAVYIDSNTEANDAQWTAIQEALRTYGTDHVLGIAIGNEYILNQVDQVAGATQLLSQIKTYNASLQAMNLNKSIPMGTSDAGSVLTVALAEGIDFYHANVHPWFANVSIDDAAGWTYDFFQNFDIEVANQVTTRAPPSVMIGECGWPTDSMDKGSLSDGPSIASVGNLQTFLDTFVCQANANGTLMQTFMFEFRDANWKAPEFGGVEPFWGLYDDSTVLKNLTIPDCPIN